MDFFIETKFTFWSMSIYRIGQTITYTNIITRKFVRLYDRDTTDMNVPQTNKVIQVSSEGWQISMTSTNQA